MYQFEVSICLNMGGFAASLRILEEQLWGNLGMAESFRIPAESASQVEWTVKIWNHIICYTGYIYYPKKHPVGWNDQFSYVKAQVLSIDFIE